MTTLPAIRVRVDGPVGTIVIQRAEHRNSLDGNTMSELLQAWDDLHQQKAVRAVILTGDGQTFCAGSDLHAIQAAQQDAQDHVAWFPDISQWKELLAVMLRFPKPIIAAVNGSALGAGLALVAAADLVLAAPNARFGLPETRRGLTAGPTLPLLSFRIGASRASQLAYLPHEIDAETARQWGLVHEIVPWELLWARGREWTLEIATASAAAVAMNKRILNETVGENCLTQLSSACAAMAATRTTQDAMEGVAAFLAGRTPVW